VAWGEVLARAEPILCVASCHGEADVLREIHGGLIERAARRGCPLCGGGGGESGFEMGWEPEQRRRREQDHNTSQQGSIKVAWGGGNDGRRRCVVGGGVTRERKKNE
jgi:hypothetical protein